MFWIFNIKTRWFDVMNLSCPTPTFDRLKINIFVINIKTFHSITCYVDDVIVHQLFSICIINIISIDMVLKRLEERGSQHITVSKNKEYQSLSGILESFDESVKKSPSNLLLRNI